MRQRDARRQARDRGLVAVDRQARYAAHAGLRFSRTPEPPATPVGGPWPRGLSGRSPGRLSHYSGLVERTITGFHLDEEDDWVAELSCWHNQHVRHRPPFQLRPWVTLAEGRAAKIGAPLDCLLCARAELPEGLEPARTSPEWDQLTVPPGLLRDHRLSVGTWGVIRVLDGRLHFVMAGSPGLDVILDSTTTQAIPPSIRHHVTPLGTVRFSIDFFTGTEREGVDGHREGPERGDARDEGRGVTDAGGDPACWAGSVCPDCGSVADDGPHRPGCPRASAS